MAIFLLARDDDAEADSLFTLELDVVTDADRAITINDVTDADGSITISAPCSLMDSSVSVLLARRWIHQHQCSLLATTTPKPTVC